jgi:beta-phosphoglucomutase-like phosphatase (HAD superfamily)
VLCDTKVLHYRALNLALRPFRVTVPWLEDDHPACYHDARILRKTPVPPSQHRALWLRKQAIALDLVRKYPFEAAYEWRESFAKLKREGHQLACCAWEHPQVLMLILMRLGVLELLDVVLSAEDAKNPPPHPEMLWDAVVMAQARPDETLVVAAWARAIPGLSHVVQIPNPRRGFSLVVAKTRGNRHAMA